LDVNIRVDVSIRAQVLMAYELARVISLSTARPESLASPATGPTLASF
jgi:hypothetical protein